MTTPALKTARLTLAPPFMHEGMDVSHYLRWLNNETVVKFSEQRHKVHTNESQYEYLNWFPNSEDCFWEIQRNTVPIGSISAYRFLENKIANIGIIIGDTRLWGQGYGPEAWQAVCDYLFEDGTRKIEASCMASNLPMIHLLEKLDFKYEATISGHFLLNGKPEDKVCYGKHRKAKIFPIKKET